MRSGSLGRVGIVANPCAGAGPDVLRRVLTHVYGRLRADDVVLNAGTFEAAQADACGLACRKVHGPAGDARRLTEALLAAGAETVIGVGGDGTLGEIATALTLGKRDARLLGIGIGSSNVGPLIGTTLADIGTFFDAPWADVAVHALGVRVDQTEVGIAFHDVTPANTYFGTRNGRRVDLDAAAALRGADRTADPTSVCEPGTWVAKNGRRILPEGAAAGGQIVASPLNDVSECRGKAVSGFLCWGPYVGCRGVVAIASAVMIRTRLSSEDLRAAEPLRLFHIGLTPADVVEFGGLPRGAAVVVDGTPRIEIAPEKTVAVRAIDGAVVSIRRAAGCLEQGEKEEGCSTAAS